MFKKLIFIFLILSIGFATEKGKVYLIPGSDASNNPYRLTEKSGMLWSGQIYSNPGMSGYRIMDPSFRNQYRDSNGNTLKMTWWMMGGNIYHISRNCDIPIRSNMNIHLMKKYHWDAIENFGDQLSFHYHNYLYSDPNGDGLYHWNQGTDFSLSKEDYEQTLCKYLIEDDVFPISFRSGWHYMNNEWQMYQERFIPFDMSNAYPSHTGSIAEPSWYVDWSESPSAFIPYHPNKDNYQIEGDLKQWRLRSLFFQDYNLLSTNLEIMFQEAANGSDQMVCVWGHLAEGAFLSGIDNLHKLAQQFSEQYGVEFLYCKDIDAMRLWINPEDTIAPILSVNEISDGDNLRFAIETSEPIFQAEAPFITVKTIYETYQRLNCTITGENQWETIDAIPASILAKVAVAVCDSVGNQSKVHLDYVPDDIFVDNQDSEFQENSGSWNGYTTGELWDLNARLLVGAGSVSIRPELKESKPYKILFHGPGSNSDNVRYIIQSGTEIDTIIHNSTLLGTDKWQQVGIFNLDEGSENILTIENLNSNKNLGIDVVRFSPLVPEKLVVINCDSLMLGDVSIKDTIFHTISISNSGYEELTINVSNSGNKIFIPGDFPTILNPGEVKNLIVTFYSEEYGEYFDEIIIETDDPLNPEIKIDVSANVCNYYKIVDNEETENYKEVGTDWFYSSVAGYGPTSRCAWILGNGFYADFQTSLKYDARYIIQHIVPETQNAHDHADYIIFVDGNPIDTIVVDQNAGSGEFVSIGEFDFPANKPIKVRLQDNGGNTNTNPNIVLRADAIKFVLQNQTHISNNDIKISKEYQLYQNYPNPFNPITHIQYYLPKKSAVSLIIYDLSGRKIKDWHFQSQSTGEHELNWDGSDNSGQRVSTGIYFYQIKSEDFVQTRKMVFMK